MTVSPIVRSGDRWIVVVAAGILSFTAMMEMSALNLALPAIARHTGTTTTVAQIAIIGYQAMLTICLIPAGRFLAAHDARRTVLGALTLFAATGVLAAFAPGDEIGIVWTTAWRTLQGAAAAVLFVCMPLLSTGAVSPQRRARALSVTTGLGSLGIVMGPVLAGPLIDNFGWQSALLLKIPACVAAGWILARTPPGSLAGARGRPPRSDGGRPEDETPTKHIVLAVGLVASAASVVPLGVSIALQAAGGSATDAAMVIIVQAAAMAAVGLVAGMLADRIGPSRLVVIGVAAVTVGLVAMVLHRGDWSIGELAWRLALVGVGMGLYGGPAQAWVMSSVAPARAAIAASHMQLARTTGFIVGPLVAASLWTAPVVPNPALTVAAAVAACAAILLAHHRTHHRTTSREDTR
ncbi:MFS transporter [Rhodococcus sp. UNC23MFCrub1.1]|uniref:MFS transporter n=1 Tax=Rhodococcus sp. UNC23MFCrub1.1 TaxID=1449068 RepID=UPI00048964DC|nr:MFS transporter [Rhodococcus sp. UNC23MFCrub1.1]